MTISKIRKKPPSRCTGCKREKERAINEQVSRLEICGVETCTFAKDIEKAIKEYIKPELIRFETSSDEILENETIEVFWEVTNCKTIIIEGVGSFAENIGNTTFLLSKSQDILIQMEDIVGTIYEYRKPIKVHKKPIFSFKNFQNPIRKDSRALIGWEVMHHEKIIIKDEDGNILKELTKRTEFETPKLSINTAYTFEISGKLGFILNQTIEVNVLGQVVINSFSSDKNFTIQSKPVVLFWDIANVDKLVISPNIGEVTGTNQINVYPTTRTVYTIEASNKLYPPVTAQIVIDVLPIPRFNRTALTNIPILQLNAPVMPLLSFNSVQQQEKTVNLYLQYIPTFILNILQPYRNVIEAQKKRGGENKFKSLFIIIKNFIKYDTKNNNKPILNKSQFLFFSIKNTINQDFSFQKAYKKIHQKLKSNHE